jgi:hypothetical protein
MGEAKEEKEDGYTQREWDRVVGYGTVPEEYSRTRHNEHLEKQRRYDRG